MARFSLEEAPPTRGRMPAHPKNRDKDTAAYDAYKQWQADQQVRRKQNEEAAKVYLEEKVKRNEEAAKELNRKKDVVMSHLINSAKSIPITANEIKTLGEEQRQEKLNKVNDYKLGLKSLVTAAELGLSGGSLLGAWANYKNWATAASASKRAIANLLQRAQAPMQLNGTLIDGYQTLDAINNKDEFNKYYNAGSAGLGLAGYIGAKDIFRGRYPLVDRTLDVLGIIQNSGDFIKFGYDAAKDNNK
jgi:hypothetical protein